MPNQKQFWEKSARKYDRDIKKGPNYAARIERCATWLGTEANVLDAGCASGHITLDLAPHVRHILGVDIAQTHIDLASERAASKGLANAEFVCAPMDDPRFDELEHTIDGITCFSLLHLVDNPHATLRRFYRLLRPGGQLIIEAPCLSDYSFAIRWLIVVMQWVGKAPPIVNFTLPELETMIRKAGFAIVESKVYNPKSGQQAILARKVG